MNTAPETNMNDEIHYFTVVIPFAERDLATEWHPTERRVPFSVLTRGAFKATDDAHAWAKTNLGLAPYGITEIGFDEARGDWSRVVKSYCYDEVYACCDARVAEGLFGSTPEIVAFETGLPLEQVTRAIDEMTERHYAEIEEAFAPTSKEAA